MKIYALEKKIKILDSVTFSAPDLVDSGTISTAILLDFWTIVAPSTQIFRQRFTPLKIGLVSLK